MTFLPKSQPLGLGDLGEGVQNMLSYMTFPEFIFVEAQDGFRTLRKSVGAFMA